MITTTFSTKTDNFEGIGAAKLKPGFFFKSDKTTSGYRIRKLCRKFYQYSLFLNLTAFKIYKIIFQHNLGYCHAGVMPPPKLLSLYILCSYDVQFATYLNFTAFPINKVIYSLYKSLGRIYHCHEPMALKVEQENVVSTWNCASILNTLNFAH